MSSVVTTERIRSSLTSAHEQLRGSGTWWNAVQLGAIASRARDGFVQRGRPPWLRDLPDTVDGLPAEAVEVIDRVVADWILRAIFVPRQVETEFRVSVLESVNDLLDMKPAG